jgi:hypothetical protein
MMLPVVLLWNSVHLGGAGSGPWPTVSGAAFLVSGFGLALGGLSLQRLTDRPGGLVIPLSLAAAILSGGLCILLAGYIKGGAVAFPLAGSVVGVLAASSGWSFRGRLDPLKIRGIHQGSVAWGVCSLYGVLMVGCAFGKLPGMRALLLGLAPLAAWVGREALLPRFSAQRRGVVGLVLTMILLGVALGLAKRDFDEGLGKMLEENRPRPAEPVPGS